MKIILDCHVPAMLAHGGAQIQMEQTKAGLETLGVEVEYLRWWDRDQRGDLVHFFGTASNAYLALARTAKKPVVMTNLFSETCNRSRARLKRQGWLVQAALKFPFGGSVKQQLTWGAYQQASHHVVGLECEKYVLQRVYRVPADRISVVPLGLPEQFLQAGPGLRDAGHLIYTGTIYPVKFSVELAQMARAAATPMLFVGKPYSPKDPYWLRFQKLVDGQYVKYMPHVENPTDLIALLRAARGFVLMSQFENWSLSTHEAIACGLPLLVPDQNWSRERFGDLVRYFDRLGEHPHNVEILKKFYADAPRLTPPPIKLFNWTDVARKLKIIYEKVLTG